LQDVRYSDTLFLVHLDHLSTSDMTILTKPSYRMIGCVRVGPFSVIETPPSGPRLVYQKHASERWRRTD